MGGGIKPDCRRAALRQERRSTAGKDKALRVAIDTKPIIGRGAVLDTYNLLAASIANLQQVWNWQEGQNVPPAHPNPWAVAMTVRIAIRTAFYALSLEIHLELGAIRRTIQTAIT